MVETKPKTLFDMIREKLNPLKKVEEFEDTTGISKSPVVEEPEPIPETQPIRLSDLRPPYSPDRTRPERSMSEYV